jgi:hypothetical protein
MEEALVAPLGAEIALLKRQTKGSSDIVKLKRGFEAEQLYRRFRE